jgi:hypothetical protein
MSVFKKLLGLDTEHNARWAVLANCVVTVLVALYWGALAIQNAGFGALALGFLAVLLVIALLAAIRAPRIAFAASAALIIAGMVVQQVTQIAPGFGFFPVIAALANVQAIFIIGSINAGEVRQ